jgi:hypothetical protein
MLGDIVGPHMPESGARIAFLFCIDHCCRRRVSCFRPIYEPALG